MPQLGETVTEGTITRWFKQVGETVAPTSRCSRCRPTRSTPRCPPPAAGVLTEILVPEGDTVEVGARLAVIGDEGRRPHRLPTRRPPRHRRLQPEPRRAAARAGARARRGRAAAAATRARAAACTCRPRRRRAPAPAPAARRPHPRRRPATVAVTSPVVRRLIAEHGLDPEQIPAPAKAVASPATTCSNASPSAPHRGSPRRRPRPVRRRLLRLQRRPRRAERAIRQGDEVVPFDNIRRRTAEHMVRSKATSAHVYTSVEVDFERIERVRRANQAAWKARRGLLAHVPAVHRARVLRRRARLPERERERRRRLARRAPRPPPRHRGRPRLQGSDRAGHPQRRRQAAAAHRPRDPRPRDPRQERSSSAPTRSSAARSRSRTWARSARR